MAVRGCGYWDAKGRKLDIEGMLEDLSMAPEGSIVLLHCCARLHDKVPLGLQRSHKSTVAAKTTVPNQTRQA